MSKHIHIVNNLHKIDKIANIKGRLNINKTPINNASKFKYNKILFSTLNLTNNTNKTNGTETVDTSFRGNKNILIEGNDLIVPYKNKSITIISKTNQGKIKKKHYSKLVIGKIEYQLPKKYESRKFNNTNIEKSQTFFSKKEYINESSLSSNNISFKEIKYDEKSIKTFSKNSKIRTNYEFNGKAGQLSDNVSLSYRNLNKKLLKHHKTSIFLKSIMSNIDKMEKTIFNERIYHRINLKNKLIRENNKEINKTAEKINNRKKLYLIKQNFISKLNSTNKNDINKNEEKKKSLYKYLINHPKLSKIQKINTKLTINNLQNLKMKINSNKLNNKQYINNICRIQSIWKSILYRKKFLYHNNLFKFRRRIYSMYINSNKKIIIELLKYLSKQIKNKNYSFNDNSFVNEYFHLKNKETHDIKIIPFEKYYNNFKLNKKLLKDEIKPIIKNNKLEYEISKSYFNLIKNKKELKEICHNDSINITTNQIFDYILIKNIMSNLIEEKQNNLNIHFEGIKEKKPKPFQNNIIDEKVNNINIIYNRKINKHSIKDNFPIDNHYLNVKNEIFSFKENTKKNKESSQNDIPTTFFSEKYNEYKVEHEGFSLINNMKNIIQREKIKLLIPKNENSFILKSKKSFGNIKQHSINSIYFKRRNKVYASKSTETTDELKKLNKTECNKKFQIEYFSIIIKKIKNENKCSEIGNKSRLKINLVESKRQTDFFICKEKTMEILKKKECSKSEKTKINIMKILFPIRIKSSLLLYTKQYVFNMLLNNLRNICFISHLINTNEKYMDDFKRNFFEKMKKINVLYYKNFYYKQIAKKKLLNLLFDYAQYKRRKFLIEIIELLNMYK